MTPDEDSVTEVSDVELKHRTEELLGNAERISAQLVAQTELLAEAIDSFNREIIVPLREAASRRATRT